MLDVKQITHVKTKPYTNDKQNMETYADNYENHAFGIMQEGIQNAADACKGNYQELVIRIKVDTDARTLTIDDNGPGMPHCEKCVWGIVSINPWTPCTNKECPWAVYHSYSNSGKIMMDDKLGSRGMGKSLQVLAGPTTLVTTTLPDGRWATSKWTVDKDSVFWELDECGQSNVNKVKTGSTFLTEGVRADILRDLSDINTMVKDISYRWFALINRGARITYVLVKNGNKVARDVPLLKWPEYDTEHGQGRIAFKTLATKDIGELHNVEICVAKEPFDEDDPRWGIAIVKNGVQTIVSFREFGLENKGVERRLFGQATFYPGSKNEFLRKAEAPSHTRFNQSDPHYIAMRKALRAAIFRLAEPYLDKPKNYIKSNATSKRLTEIFAKTFSKYPEFRNLFGVKWDETPVQDRAPKDRININRIEIQNIRYDAGDEIPIRVFVHNPEKEQMIRVRIEQFEPRIPGREPDRLWQREEGIIAHAGTIEHPKAEEIGWVVKVSKQHLAGRHHFVVSLFDVKGQPILDNDGKPIWKGCYVSYMVDVPEHTKTPRTPRVGGNGFLNVTTTPWDESKNIGDGEVAHDLGSNTLYINEKCWRMKFYENMPQQQIWGVIGDMVIGFAIRKQREARLSEKGQWTEGDIVALENELHKLKLNLFRDWTSEGEDDA